jgi:hypothetical protein
MNGFLVAGAVLAVAVGVAHSYLGERYILIRLFRRSDLPTLFGSDDFTKRTLRFAWHLTTLAWWGAALILFAYGTSLAAPSEIGIRIISVTFLASAVLALVASRGRHLSWLVFLAIALAAWLGAKH